MRGLLIAWVLLSPLSQQDRLTPYRTRLAKENALHERTLFGRRHVYVDVGRGPVLVLIHGLGGSLYDWRHVTGSLVRLGYRVIAPDLLGAGESEMPEEADYSLLAQARRVKGLLDELKIDKATLAGASMGGGVAMVFAVDWPERVEKLILIDSVCYPEQVPGYMRLCRLPMAGELMQKTLPTKQVVEWGLKSCYKDESRLSSEEIEAYCAELQSEERRAALVRTLRAMLSTDHKEILAGMERFDRPTLIVWGTSDETVPVELGRRLAKQVPGARFVELDAGHLPNQERPEELVAKMREFLLK